MNIRVRDGLPFVSASVIYRGQDLELRNVIIDTGSAGTVMSADTLAPIGVRLEPEDPIHRIQGVGGSEFVFGKCLDSFSVGALHVAAFEVEVGAMDYGFELDGIVGMDFLLRVGAIIDLGNLEIRGS